MRQVKCCFTDSLKLQKRWTDYVHSQDVENELGANLGCYFSLSLNLVSIYKSKDSNALETHDINLLVRNNQRYELSNDTSKYAHKKVQWINDSSNTN